MRAWAAGLAHAFRAVVLGDDSGKPLDHQCAIHLGHVVIGPALMWFLSPALAVAYALAFGVAKQIRDALRGSGRNALLDALAMCGLTALSWAVYVALPWGDMLTLRAPLWLLSPLWSLGVPMALTLAVYAAESGRRDLQKGGS
jgi:hypothetical protein